MIDETDRLKAIERANSYRQMMDLWAWKDFERFLDETRQSALEKGIKTKDSDERNDLRGIVLCIDSIKSELGYILGGADGR